LLVTGAAGFIGGRLLSTLARLEPARIVALDRQPLGANPFLDHHADNLVETRLALGDAAADALDRALEGVDAVFHLAAVKYRAQGEPMVDIVRSNILGTAAVLDACTRAAVPKLVFASSLFAYGRERGAPFDEDEPARPTTLYGHSKRVGEELCSLASTRAPVPRVTVLRYMFVYGPSQTPKHGYPSVIPKNFLRMLRGESPVIYGDGAQVLDYVFIDDAITATLHALRPEADGRVYNLGSGTGTSIRALIDLMREHAGFAGPPEFGPADATAGTVRVARIARIHADLGWAPTTPLRDGLAQTLASIREHPQWYT
jgi:UDP-glucose 4-epimerase